MADAALTELISGDFTHISILVKCFINNKIWVHKIETVCEAVSSLRCGLFFTFLY